MRVAVIIAARDVVPFIGDAVGSVLAQSHRDFSLTLVDDGSCDGTAEAADRFADHRLSLIRQPNAGVSAARNRGAAHAAATRPDALLFLDGDDWLSPDALSRLVSGLAAAPGAAAAHAPFAFVAEAATPSAPGLLGIRAAPARADLLPSLILGNLFANGGHLLIRADHWARAGGFRNDLRFGEDWEAWTRLALQGPIVAIGGEPALFVRRRTGSAMDQAATRPSAYDAALAAIGGNPEIVARLGAGRLARLHRRARREVRWAAGRGMLRRGEARTAWPHLLRGLTGRFRPTRLLILAQALARAISDMASSAKP